jgi:hypothetical protein
MASQDPASKPPAWNPDTWWPVAEVERRVHELASRYPETVQTEVFGQTCRGRPLTGLRVGSRSTCIALIGAVHGGESGPEIIIPVIERLLEHDRNLLERVGIAALPSVNCEAREQRVLGKVLPCHYRKSLNGVNLNLNFPSDWDIVSTHYNTRSNEPASFTYRGPAPVSEPETRAVMNLVTSARPEALFSFHFINSIAGACFHGPFCAKDDAGYVGRCLDLVRPYTKVFYDDPAGRAAKRLYINYPDFGGSLYYMFYAGTLCTWVYRTFGVPSFDVEQGSDLPAEEAALADAVTREHLQDCQERHYLGLRAVLELIKKET